MDLMLATLLRAVATMNENTGPVDPGITAEKLAERDRGVCAECGIPVVAHPEGWVEDGWAIGHKKSLLAGGTHTWDNVQCECQSCARFKHNRGGATNGSARFDKRSRHCDRH